MKKLYHHLRVEANETDNFLSSEGIFLAHLKNR